MSAPFADLVVVDLATLNAAPLIATFFADLGARVVKIEHPRGDALRQLVDPSGAALQWKLANRNKACVTLDVAGAGGRDLLERFLDRADLLVCALPADRLAEWRLDRASIETLHRRLVVVNLTTYGVDGPWSERAGSGTLAEAATGLAHLTGAADGPPTLAPVGLGDHLGVMHGIVAALTGLAARDRGGERWFDLSMTAPLLALLGPRLALVARTGVDPGRRGNRFPTMAPRNTYRAADGRFVAITAGTNDLVVRLFAVIGSPELANDPRFRTNRARLANVDTLDGVIGAWIAAQPAAAAVDALAAARVSAAVVDDVQAVLTNPHFRARGEIVSIDDPDLGATTTAAPSLAGAGTIRHLGRDLGADNRAVYVDWLGLDEVELERLRAAGVV